MSDLDKPTDITTSDYLDDFSSDTCDDFFSTSERDNSSVDDSSKNSSDGHGGLASIKNAGRAVSGARCCFLFVLLLAAGALSGVVYWLTNEEEIEDFHSQFANYGLEVIEASNENVKKAFQALETLSVTITSFIKEQADNGYPAGFVKVPDTEYHFTKAKDNARAFVIGFMPHVAREDYHLWTQFSTENQDWIAEANAALGIDDPRFHNDTQLFYPSLHDYKFYSKEGDEVEITYDVASCSKSEAENEITLSELNSQIVETRRVPVEPEDYNEEYYVPVWQLTPPPHPDGGLGLGNFNLIFDPLFDQNFKILEKTKSTTFYDICDGAKWFNPAFFPEGVYSLIISPVFDGFGDDARIVGTLSAVVSWQIFFEDILVQGSEPVHAVLINKCGNKKFTFLVDGNEATFLGDNYDAHDTIYDEMRLDDYNFAEFAYSEEYLNEERACTYDMHVYPTRELEATYSSKEPLIYAMVVLGVFCFTALSFFVFDCIVQRRQKDLASTAAKQNAIMASLFPKSIHKKLMQEAEEAEKNKRLTIGKAGLRKYLNEASAAAARDDSSGGDDFDASTRTKSKPIADLFPETTICFADIAGFTAWSSAREPAHVFTLLEFIYKQFDTIAKRRRVFKVEVVGDCYVAVCGLPDPRREHFVTMARFAIDCMRTFHTMTKQLEVELGPDTAELGLRVGLHSGPVVAGVLRGEKSRFQLFGDTMNTASRMESTSLPNMIQISQETANLLAGVNRAHWYKERDEKVTAKGKGELTTYFLITEDLIGKPSFNNSRSEMDTISVETAPSKPDKNRNQRSSEWTVEILSSLLTEMAIVRKARNVKPESKYTIERLENRKTSGSNTVIDEVAECIVLPDYNANKYYSGKRSDVLDDQVLTELHNYVKTIASLYNNNPFHNFAHANHVVMSVNKLLSRIVAPDLDDVSDKSLHDHTYGITSDPLTRFAVLFAALIHDVDHSGVPNAQLVKEQAPEAQYYKNKSVAEQNSVDIAWELLMEPRYTNLRSAIYVTSGEFKRFRQLVVNGVMATDIIDKDLKQLRNTRWDSAFDLTMNPAESAIDAAANRRSVVLKATIVIEHLIQASDVAHTMQHWHIYRKWNEKFFQECYSAYAKGHAEADPSKTWYKGELGFFDFYIIPLAKKLKECGVFGVSSDEYLSYAVQNRKEWEERGEALVEEMVKNVRRKEVSKKIKILSVSNH